MFITSLLQAVCPQTEKSIQRNIFPPLTAAAPPGTVCRKSPAGAADRSAANDGPSIPEAGRQSVPEAPSAPSPPTGGGKSFIALSQLMEHQNEEMLYLAPQNEILEQMKDYIIKYIHGPVNTIRKKQR